MTDAPSKEDLLDIGLKVESESPALYALDESESPSPRRSELSAVRKELASGLRSVLIVSWGATMLDILYAHGSGTCRLLLLHEHWVVLRE